MSPVEIGLALFAGGVVTIILVAAVRNARG